jgi:hypothetical protein
MGNYKPVREPKRLELTRIVREAQNQFEQFAASEDPSVRAAVASSEYVALFLNTQTLRRLQGESGTVVPEILKGNTVAQNKLARPISSRIYLTNYDPYYTLLREEEAMAES